MKVVIKILAGYGKMVELYDGRSRIESCEGEDFFSILSEALKLHGLSFRDIETVEIQSQEAVSRTALLSAFALANALNYSLGLKKLENLEFPEGPSEFYPITGMFRTAK